MIQEVGGENGDVGNGDDYFCKDREFYKPRKDIIFKEV